MDDGTGRARLEQDDGATSRQTAMPSTLREVFEKINRSWGGSEKGRAGAPNPGEGYGMNSDRADRTTTTTPEKSPPVAVESWSIGARAIRHGWACVRVQMRVGGLVCGPAGYCTSMSRYPR